MLHTSDALSIAELRKIAAAEPEHASDKWKPIRHVTIVDMVYEAARAHEIVLGEGTYAVGGGAERHACAAAWRLEADNGMWANLVLPRGTRATVGLVRSTAHHGSIAFYVGLVYIKTGACIVPFRPYTAPRLGTLEDHATWAKEGVRLCNKYLYRLAGMVEYLKDTQVGEDHIQIVWRAARNRILSWKKVGLLDNKWLNTPDSSLLGLLQAFSLVSAASYVPAVEQIQRLHGFYNIAAGAVLPAQRAG